MWPEIITVVGAGVFRNVAGWVENALEDGKFEGYEWKQLLGTTARVAVLGSAAYIGLGTGILPAAGIAVGIDLVMNKLRK